MTRRSHGALALAAALCLLAAIPTAAAAQEPVGGTVLHVGAAEIELGGRAHAMFNTTTAEGEPTGEFLMRRVRLEAKVKVNDVVSGRVMPDFAGDEVSVEDAYLRLTFAPGFQLQGGKQHRPFSRFRMTSANDILPVERGLRLRGVQGADQFSLVNGLDYSDRDVGFQVMGAPTGAPLGLAYAAGVFAGPLQGEVGAQDAYQYVARATIAPAPGLSIGTAWSSRVFADAVGAGLDPQLERGHAFAVDVEYGDYGPGLHFVGEASTGDFDPFTGTEFRGAQGWLGWRSGPVGEKVSALEPLLRASWGDAELPGGEELGGVLLTPGINVYFGGLNRVMLNYDVWMPAGDGETESGFKALFQLVF